MSSLKQPSLRWEQSWETNHPALELDYWQPIVTNEWYCGVGSSLPKAYSYSFRQPHSFGTTTCRKIFPTTFTFWITSQPETPVSSAFSREDGALGHACPLMHASKLGEMMTNAECLCS